MTSITLLETPPQSTNKKRKGEREGDVKAKRNRDEGDFTVARSSRSTTLCQIKIALGLPFLETMQGRYSRTTSTQIEGVIDDGNFVIQRHFSYNGYGIPCLQQHPPGEDAQSTGIEWSITGLANGRIHLFHLPVCNCEITGKYPQYKFGTLYESILAGFVTNTFVRKIGFWKYFYSNDTSPTLPRDRFIKGKIVTSKQLQSSTSYFTTTNGHGIHCQSHGNYIMGKRHGVWETFTRDGLLDRVLYYNEGVKIEGADVHTAILNNFPLFFPKVLYNSIIKDYTGIECDDFTLTEGDPYHTDLN